MVRKINNINRLILPKQHYILQSHSRPSILKPLNPNSIVNFRSRDVTYVTVPHCCKGDAASQWEMAILGVLYI